MSKTRTRVDIYGAGLAGLVAAINLTREDFEVHLFDRYGIGGNPAWHPSVQTTVLRPEKTWEYIGIDLSSCFRPVSAISFYRYGQKKVFTLENMYVCERGPRKGSLDTILWEKATRLGVIHHIGDDFAVEKLQFARNSIIATGLGTGVYRRLGIPYVPVYGYRGLKVTDREAILISYMEKCTNYDFAYLAADHGLLFALLFSRQKLTTQNLDEFKRILETTENIQISQWTYSTGAIPSTARLFHHDLVLAGTLSGMIDPFLLHGISGALTSGSIAAQAFVDRDRAVDEFRRLTQNFVLKRTLKALSVQLPLKRLTIPLMMLVDSRLRGVGFV